MAGTTAARDTRSDTTTQRRDVSDMITNISPKTVPLLKLLGINGFTGTNPKHEWQEDVLLALTDAVSNTTGLTTTTTTGLFLSGSNAYNFSKGDILKIESEYVWVNTIAGTTELGVIRGAFSTTAATHATTTVITKVGNAIDENVDSPQKGTTVHTWGFNYFSIFDKMVQVSYMEQATDQYNIPDRMDFEVAKTLKELMIALERQVFYGKRNVGTGTTDPASAGGLEVFITDNTDTDSEALTEQKINDLLALCFADVGHENLPDLIVVGQWQKRKISSFYEPMARMDRATRTGGVVVDVIDTEFGEIDVVMDFHCPADRLFLLNRNLVKIGPYTDSAFFDEELAISGPYDKRHVYGAYSVEVKGDKAHGLMTNLTTS